MKKFTFTLLILLVILASCGKQEDAEKDNYLVFGKEKHLMQSGMIEISHWQANGEKRTSFQIAIFDKKLSVDELQNAINDGNISENFIGVNSIGFNLDSAYNNFDYRMEGNNVFETSWDFPGYVIFNFYPGEVNQMALESGRLSIVQKNEVFEVDFEGTSKSGNEVYLYFSGELFVLETHE